MWGENGETPSHVYSPIIFGTHPAPPPFLPTLLIPTYSYAYRYEYVMIHVTLNAAAATAVPAL